MSTPPPLSTDDPDILAEARALRLAGDRKGALKLLARILAERRQAPQLWVELAHGLLVVDALDEADAALARAIARDADAGATARIAALLALKRGNKAAARAAIDTALMHDGDAADTALVAGIVAMAEGDADAAAAGFDTALARDPDLAEAAANRAALRLARGDLAGALADAAHAALLRPWNADIHVLHARAAIAAQDMPAAVGAALEALMIVERRDAVLLLAQAQDALGERDAAIASLERAATAPGTLAPGPAVMEALQIADRLAAFGQTESAIALLERALARAPDDKSLLLNLGTLRLRVKDPAGALAPLTRLTDLAPDLTEGWKRLAEAAVALHDHPTALRAARRLVDQLPDDPQPPISASLICLHLENPQESLEFARIAVARFPDRIDTLRALSMATIPMGLFDDCARVAHRILEIDPQNADALGKLSLVASLSGDHAGARRWAELSARADPTNLAAASTEIFSLDFDATSTVEEQQAARRRFEENFGIPRKPFILPHRNNRDPDRRLRIGYVSADFRRHSAADSFGPVIHHHDPDQFDLYLYSSLALLGRSDAQTERFKARATVWHDCRDMDDPALTELIRRDEIDILVDLSGHSGGNRLAVFADKPAPVQITAWGHCTGTGLSAMDYLLADPVSVPVHERPLFAETIVDLPCPLTYRPTIALPPVAPAPCLANGYVTFSVMGRSVKINDLVLRTWAKILELAPSARLVFKDPTIVSDSQRAALIARITGAGIARDRFDLDPPTATPEHMASFAKVDLQLDPFPANGGISTFDALVMGVPVIALRGKTIPGRMAAAILNAIGMERFIAEDLPGYVKIAVAAANNPAAIARFRGQLRDRLLTSPAGDVVTYTQAVEAAYRGAWRRWCAAEAE